MTKIKKCHIEGRQNAIKMIAAMTSIALRL